MTKLQLQQPEEHQEKLVGNEKGSELSLCFLCNLYSNKSQICDPGFLWLTLFDLDHVMMSHTQTH